MEVVNADLTRQLQELVVNLNKQLAEHKEKFGASITVEQQQQLQELLIKANQTLAQTQTLANTKSAEYKQGLITAWRNNIRPIVESLAKEKGASVVLVQGDSVMWYDSAIDITAEVISKLRANPVTDKSDKTKEIMKRLPPVNPNDVI